MITKTYNIDARELIIDKSEINRYMGYHNDPPKQIVEDVNSLLSDSYDNMKIQCGYRRIPAEIFKVENNSFFINATRFDCGKIIYHHIKNAEQIIIFLATLGNGFDNFSKSFFESGDPYTEYLIDTIGSVTVESAIDWMTKKLENKLNGEKLNCSNRFSPGYCDWDVIEQHKLFAELPDDFLDIKLLKSSLMKPIKSVSGIIGIGPKVKKLQYSCNICNQENCIMRRE